MNKKIEKELQRKRKLKELNGTYQYNEEKRAVTYFIVTKGEVVTGTAKCNVGDKYDRKLGEEIAYRRAHLNQRNRDLFLLREFIADLKDAMECYKEEGWIYSKHYEISVMKACEEEQSQVDQIRTLEDEIFELIEYGRVLSKVERAQRKLGRELTHEELSEIEVYGHVLSNKEKAQIRKKQKLEAMKHNASTKEAGISEG